LEPISKKKPDDDINKEKEKNDEQNIGKDEVTSPYPCNSNNNNNNKCKKINEKNKAEKNKDAIIKKLENENAHLRKLLMTYKIKQYKYENSTEKIKKYYQHFQKKSFTLNRNINNNNCNLSNIVSNKIDNSIINNQNIMTYVKNSHSNNIDKIMDKISLIPNKTKSKIKTKNSESCSILSTDGNYGKNLKRSNCKEVRSNSKKNKIYISEKKSSNKTNSKIKKISRTKLNNRNSNLIGNSRDIFDTNKNHNGKNNLNNITFNTNNFDKRKFSINNLNDKINFKRNNKVVMKTSHHSLKLENLNTNLNLVKAQNDYANYNKTNTLLRHGNSKFNPKKIKSFNKILLANIISHSNYNNNSLKLNNLFDKRRNLRMNKKKMNNYHSISSVTEKILYENKFNSSVSFDVKKPKNNDMEKSNNRNITANVIEQFVRKAENSIDNSSLKDKKDKNKLKCFMSYSSKVKKIITDNVNKNLKSINTNIRNDNYLMNHKKKNNIFFTINKTIIHNMNNTFNNSNNKNFITNINNSTEDANNDLFSPNLTKSTIANNNILYNGINLKKRLVPGYQLINSNNANNNIKFSIIKSNINNRIIRRLQNKRNIFINKNIL